MGARGVVSWLRVWRLICECALTEAGPIVDRLSKVQWAAEVPHSKSPNSLKSRSHYRVGAGLGESVPTVNVSRYQIT